MIYTTDIIGDQWSIFSKAAGLGLAFGGCYDVLRFIRTIFCFGKKLFIASDFIYCLWASFIIFSFLLNENFGIPRFYIFLGIAAGFFLWYSTMGKIDMFLAKKLQRILTAVFRPFLKIFGKILKFAKKPLNKGKIFHQKAKDRVKSLLKKKSGLVYNILCLNILKAFPVCGRKAGKEPEKVESNGTEETKERRFS